MNEQEIAKIFSDENKVFCKLKRLFIPNIVTAPSVGIESKKEIFAASTLLNLRILAAVIVIPDLLTPGIKDKIWKTPINNAE